MSRDPRQFTPEDARQARAAHFSFVCSMCVKLHAGRIKGNIVDWTQVACVGRQDCRGPMGGGAFLDYEGPLQTSLALYCWKCGKDSDGHGMRVHQLEGTRVLGCCPECIKFVGEHRFKVRPVGTKVKWAPKFGDVVLEG